MNKLKMIIFLFVLFSLESMAQKDLRKSIEYWLGESNDCEFLRKDFSSAFNYEECSYLGIFGKNKYKINIRFDTILKISDENYLVIGQSKLKNKIVGFKGEIKINSLEFYNYNNYEPLNVCLVVTGTYEFVESDENRGVFSGNFRKYVHYYLKNDSISVNLDFEVSSNEGFAGSWVNPKSGKEYSCHFGFHRYPSSLAGDFDQGGEPNIDPKYKPFGWESYFKQRQGYGSYSNTDCQDKWWLEK